MAGWGNDISGSSTDVPMAADVNIVSDQECLESNKLFAAITSSSTFCAGDVGFLPNLPETYYLLVLQVGTIRVLARGTVGLALL